MNKNYSRNEYIARYLERRLKSSISAHPAVIITGARQVGKSMLLKNSRCILAKSRYYTFDSIDELSILRSNPEEILKVSPMNVIDEVQKYPGVLSAIKKIIDDSKRKCRFILSGSTNLLLMKEVSETLAGRAIYIYMYPFSLGETLDIQGDNALDIVIQGGDLSKVKVKNYGINLENCLWKGFFPVPSLLLKKDAEVVEWFDGYVTTYLERDLREISAISDLADYKKFLKVAAIYNGTIMNETAIAAETQISQPTIHRYLNLLEMSNLIYRIPAFGRNKKKMVVKRPKVYWLDTGLVNFLADNHTSSGISERKEYGVLFETMILHHLKVWASLKVPSPKIYFFKLRSGEEVDFVIDAGKYIIPIEVKVSKDVRINDIKNLLAFLSVYPETKCALLVYSGKKVMRLSDRIFAVPYETLCISSSRDLS